MDGEHCVKRAYENILNSDFEGAIYWFEQAIAIEPDNASYYNKCAISCVRSGKWHKARQHAERALQLDPDHVEYQFHLQMIDARIMLSDADVYLAQDPPDLDAALPLLKRSTMLDPLSFKAFYTLGVVYASLGLYDDAAESAREAIRLDPAHAAARTLFADVNRKRRKLKRRNKSIKDR